MYNQRFRLGRFAIALLLAGCAALLATGMVGADPPWGPGVRVTDDETYAPQDYPAAAVASTGMVYAAWFDGRAYYEVGPVFFSRSADGGQTWSANVPITTGLWVNDGSWPAIAAAGTREVHVVWGSVQEDAQHVYYSGSADDGATWSAPQLLDGIDLQGAAMEPDVATDGAANVYVVWSEWSGLHLAHSTDGGVTWPAPWRALTATYAMRNPALAVDAARALHLVWEETVGPDTLETVICYARSDDHGIAWTPRHCFDSAVARVEQVLPDIAVNPLDGAVHVVWRQAIGNDNGIYHALSHDGGATWHTPQRLSSAYAMPTWPAVAVNVTGRAYVVWEQNPDAPEIYYVQSSDGILWSTPSRVNDPWRGTTHRHPAVAAGTTPHVLWSLADALHETYDIYATALGAPDPVTIPASRAAVMLDGRCDVEAEYAGARSVNFSDFGYTRTIYLQHDGAHLYVCMDAFHGWFDEDRAAVVYLDTDGAREIQAEADDYALKVNFVEGTLGAQSSWFGSGNPASPYSPTHALLGWTGVATYTSVIGPAGSDVAEYRIPLTLTGGLCGAPFGLAVYHQGYTESAFDPYGWPGNQFYDAPHTWQLAYYAGAPCPTPTYLPVFRLLPPNVTPEVARQLAGRLDGITGTEVITGDTHAGTGRWFVVDEGHGTQFELFGASGGFLASNPARAFGDGAPMNPNAGNPAQLGCQFLLLNALFTGQTPAYAQNCQNPAGLGYNTILIKQAMLTSAMQAMAMAAQEEIAGVVVQVPVGVTLDTFRLPVAQANAPAFNPQPEPPGINVPFDGPGGHLSLLFLTIDPASSLPSLDSSVPGLGAIAAPSFGRRLQEIGMFRAVSYAKAAQQARIYVRQSMPQATDINLGDGGNLIYYLGDPAVPQSIVLPMWAFDNVSVTLGSEMAAVRGFYIPAVEGMMPSVTIVTPAEGTAHSPVRPLTLTATIAEGAAPYTYTLALDDGTALAEGVTDGDLTLPHIVIPGVVRPGDPVSLTLRLDVTDTNRVSGWATVNLRPVIFNVYLPLVLREANGGSVTLSLPRRIAPLANYNVGVEWVADR